MYVRMRVKNKYTFFETNIYDSPIALSTLLDYHTYTSRGMFGLKRIDMKNNSIIIDVARTHIDCLLRICVIRSFLVVACHLPF